jgi:hypothetical protein
MGTSLLKAGLILALAVGALAAEPSYRNSQLEKIFPEWKQVGGAINISKIEFRETPWSDIVRGIERLSREHDPKRQGIRITVPERFKGDFAKISADKFTIRLGPNVNIDTIFLELGPVGWCYFPISAREVALIPQSAVIQDFQK